RRSTEPQRDIRQSGSAQAPGQGAALHHALHGRGRAAGRSHRDHRAPGRHLRRHAGRALPHPRRRQPGEGLPGPHGPEPARLMMLTAFLAMVRKDLTLFANDRRALVMAFAAPIAIASFFGSIFPGPTTSNEAARVAIHLVDEDGGAIAAAIMAGVKANRGFKVSVSAAEPARAAVRRGASAVAVIIPPGFGEAAGR